MSRAFYHINKSETEYMMSFIICRLTVVVGIDKNNNFDIFTKNGEYVKNKWVASVAIYFVVKGQKK